MPRPLPGYGYRVILVIAVLVVFILGGGYAFYLNQRHQLQQNAEKDLAAIANLKVQQITAWRQERLADADTIQSDYFVTDVPDRISNRDPALGDEIKARLESLKRTFPFSEEVLVDDQGAVLMSLNGTANLNLEAIDHLSQAFFAQRSIMVDFFNHEATGKPLLQVITPLLKTQGGALRPVAAVVFYIDPELY